MKTKGRFIGILAVLSLLIAMLPIGSVGAAVAGTAVISGGVTVGTGTTAKTYFSNQTGFNIVSATVTDTDLSPLRAGQVRFQNVVAAVTTYLIVADSASVSKGVMAGEATKTDTFTADGDTANDVYTLTYPATDRANGTPAVFDGALTIADVTMKLNGEPITAPVIVIGATNRITTVALPAASNIATVAGQAVTISYTYTDYTAAAGNIPGSSVKVFTGAGINNETTEVLDIVSVNTAGGIITIGTAVAATNEVKIDFSFEVIDTKTKLFTLSTPTSGSLGKNRLLSGVETGVATDAFLNKIALFSAAELAKIETQAVNASNDLVAEGGDASTTVEIDELNMNAGLATAGLDDGSVLLAKVVAAAGAINATDGSAFVVNSDSASSLIPFLLPVADGELITVSYTDASPAATITSTQTVLVDLGSPVITLQSPSHKLYTSVGTQQMLAKVSDAGAGLDQASIRVNPPTGAVGTPVVSANTTGGYDASLSPTTALTEGLKSWHIMVKDRVGNTPARNVTTTTPNEGALGGSSWVAGPALVAADNAFKFTVDTSGPTAATASTGYYLKNPGVLTGTGAEVETADNRKYVKYHFDLGTGAAPIDPLTVTASDFTVGGAVPISVNVNAVAQGSDVVGSSIYLEVAEQATNSKPSVVLVGSISDKAGNARTSGTKTAADKLSPALTVTTDLSYSEKTVLITVTSSETLSIPPSVVTRPTVTVGTTAGRAGTAQTVQSTGLTSWSATFTNPAAGATKQWLVVQGTDAGSNTTILGDSFLAGVASTADVKTFQVDDSVPVVRYPAATGTSTEGDVWIVVRYDEDEYVGDTKEGITVKSATLNGVDVSNDVFVGTTTTGVHSTDINANFPFAAGEKHGTVTLARNLAVGTHKYVLVVQDSALNSSATFTHTLTVTAQTKISIVLNPGVNLVSIPGTPVGDGGNINTLLAALPVTSVATYDRALDVAGSNPWLTSTKDAETGLFTGDISTIEPGTSYFITATARGTAKVLIATPSMQLPPTQQVLQGWNSIGYWAISGAANADLDSYLSSVKWSVAYTYSPTPGVGWTVERASSAVTDTRAANGVGWLVYITADGTLTP